MSSNASERPTFRRATEADAPALGELLRAAYRENEKLGVEYHAPAVSDERVREALRTSEVWVAEQGGRLVGTVGLKPKVEVRQLAVAPDRRGEGLAAELLAFAERRAVDLGHANAELFVDGDHPWLPAFYARRGWRQEGRVSVPEWPDWHMLRFRKRLE